MSRDKSTHDTLLRQLCMLRAIPRYPRKTSTSELERKLRDAEFIVTQRTIQRDLVTLSVSLPLQSDNAKPQGWSWKAEAPLLDLPYLEPQTALVFYLAEKHLHSLLPASTLGYLAAWFQAASGVLDSHGNGLSNWRRKIRVLATGQPLHPPKIGADIQATVTQALLLEKQVRIRYRGKNKKDDKEYVAHPIAMVVRDQLIYLICMLRDYEDIKQLVLHRVSQAELLDGPSRKPKGFDLDKYIDSGEFGYPMRSEGYIDLVADFSRSAAVVFQERPLDRNQQIEEIDEGIVRLKATVPDTRELRRWLLGFGDQVAIIGPESLRTEMRELLKRMLAGLATSG